MAVPGFQEMFLPFLQCLSDGDAKHTSVVRDSIENALQISEADRQEMIPSGQSSKVANRVGWTRTHLNKAGLVEQVSRGYYRITPEGLALLANPPAKLDLKFLDTIPRHREWFHSPKDKEDPRPKPVGEIEQKDTLPPNERIEEAFEELNATLASSLLEAMLAMEPFRFEKLVIDLLFAMGYGGSREEAARVTQKSNDEGIDGIINEDRLGLDVIYVQAKRWKNPVGRPEIQSFVGALAGKQAHKGVFITTSSFGQGAIDYAAAVPQKVILIDGSRLAALMIDHGIGVSTIRTITLKRIDSDYFEES
jgi:restriction system protein